MSDLVLSDHFRSGGVAVLSDHILESFDIKKTHIGHGEAFAVYFAFTHEIRNLARADVLWFIDNLGVLSALCKGSSKSLDLGCITYGSLLLTAAHDILLWWDHVESAANCADGGSRQCDRIARRLGVVLKDRALPHWPAMPRSTLPFEWLQLISG